MRRVLIWLWTVFEPWPVRPHNVFDSIDMSPADLAADAAAVATQLYARLDKAHRQQFHGYQAGTLMDRALEDALDLIKRLRALAEALDAKEQRRKPSAVVVVDRSRIAH